MASNTLIEGLDDNQKTGLLQVIIPAADALETVSISTSNYDAEFGRSGGAVTNVTLKSGTNDLKGSAFFFGNNEKTNAGDYFTHLKAPTKFVNGGFTLGGPIVKSKLFFFGDYQRTLDNNGYVVRATVPTLAMRNGDFSAATSKIYDPLTGDVSGANRVAVRRQHHSAGSDQPDRAEAARLHSRAEHRERRARSEQLPEGADAREDHRRVRRQGQLHAQPEELRCPTASASCARWSSIRALFGEYGGPANGGFAGTGTNTSSSTAVTWTRVFSAKTVLDVRGGLNYYHNVTATTGNGLTTSTDVGIPGANLDEFTSGLSNISIGGYTDPLLGLLGQPAVGPLREDLERHGDAHQADEHAHGEARRRVAAQPRHAAADTGRRRAARPIRLHLLRHRHSGRCASSTSVANAFASFLLDWPNGRAARSQGHRRAGHETHGHRSLFVHDKWQARSERDRRSRTALGVLLAARGARGEGHACPTTTRRRTRCASRDTATRTTR